MIRKKQQKLKKNTNTQVFFPTTTTKNLNKKITQRDYLNKIVF